MGGTWRKATRDELDRYLRDHPRVGDARYSPRPRSQATACTRSSRGHAADTPNSQAAEGQ
jgi:hypothetical protein